MLIAVEFLKKYVNSHGALWSIHHRREFAFIISLDPEMFSEITSSSCTYRCLEFLLQNDANPALRDKEGYNSIHYAAAYGHRQCLELVSCFVLTHTHTHTLEHMHACKYPDQTVLLLMFQQRT